ncbi:hypothetical protein HDV63DRAFT_402259 [Trichoderma sp. SZMC 28014]
MKEKTNLLLVVSHVAALRQQETKRQLEEQQEREHNQQELILQSEEAAKEEEKETIKFQELEAQSAKERVEAWKRIHDAKARRNYFSRAQVDEEVMRMVRQVDCDLGLAKRRMEDGTEEPHEEWRERMLVLREAIYRLWNENEERIRGALPRDDEEEEKGDKVKEKVYEWGWLDEDSDMEPVGEMLEMWKRRKRGDRLEVIGSGMQWVEAGCFALPRCDKVKKGGES